MSAVRPEFGPTLPELVGPRLAALSRRGRIALGIAAGAVAIAVVAVLALRAANGPISVVVGRPVAFRVSYASGLERVVPRSGESLRLRTVRGRPAETLTVRPLRLAPYRGDATAALMILTPRLEERMRATIPGFQLRQDGRARVNLNPGYQIQYQARIGGRTVYGRRILVVPATDERHPTPTRGLDVDLRSTRSMSVPRVDVVGNDGALKTPFRSLRFGTEPS